MCFGTSCASVLPGDAVGYSARALRGLGFRLRTGAVECSQGRGLSFVLPSLVEYPERSGDSCIILNHV